MSTHQHTKLAVFRFSKNLALLITGSTINIAISDWALQIVSKWIIPEREYVCDLLIIISHNILHFAPGHDV